MDFLLEPEIAFLNHGSFGACPQAVFSAYQQFQQRLESQPVRFLQREFPALLADARAVLAEFVGAAATDVVFVPNPTFAVNEIARSLDLSNGDELLMSDHEYGACRNAWRFMSRKQGFRLVEKSITLPVHSEKAIVDEFWCGVTSRTKVIFLSHITSPTALTIPVAEICRRARQRGDIITVIDGAHAPGQLDLQLEELGADFYVATCHKWLCAPKGASFLYARSDRQALIEPLVVGWGWGEDRTIRLGSDFLDCHEWLGTQDPAAYLAVPAAIDFQRRHDWFSVRSRCRDLAQLAVDQAAEIDGVNRVHPPAFSRQMGLVEIEAGGDEKAIQQQLREDSKVEVPVIRWHDRSFVRISVQAYNTRADIDALTTGLARIAATRRSP